MQVDPFKTITKDATMPRVKQAAKHARTTKAAAATALGTAGLGLSLGGTHPRARYPLLISRNLTTSRPISASFLAKRKWPTSASPRSISSIRKSLAATCSSSPPLLSAGVAVVAEDAAPAAAALCVAARAAGLRRLLRALGTLPQMLGSKT